ncbi:DNA-binding transcriptional regulator, HxlR family [Chitinophaga eiseniae]|uniref:DNA-binding transcriptional regulator, HxlR family n=1 Tax=Chitinophaga eiseniae TaxID=634771 RepID=A0A1T4LA70_9BACT|nr:helix-turn-helix domain-containing protein [Chitinophaga eiseniae]SJZ51493.1 DNA-binding transcriptional regulator, HxlR family [Chitinophaga eiseniae]
MSKIKDTSVNFENKKNLEETCAEIYAVNLISGQWILSICYYLKQGKLRFTELKNKIPNITERMLTLQLKKMEEDKLVSRTAYAEVPLRVEYELTPIGKGLLPILAQLEQWGKLHKSMSEGSAT